MSAKQVSKTKTKKTTTSIIDELLPGFSERSERGRRNRRKGAEYERDVANVFKLLFPDARREHGQTRDGGDAADVEGTPFWIECTKGNASIFDKLEQGMVESTREAARKRNTLSGKHHARPVLVCSRRNGKRTRHIVSMDRDQFIDLLADAIAGRLMFGPFA